MTRSMSSRCLRRRPKSSSCFKKRAKNTALLLMRTRSKLIWQTSWREKFRALYLLWGGWFTSFTSSKSWGKWGIYRCLISKLLKRMSYLSFTKSLWARRSMTHFWFCPVWTRIRWTGSLEKSIDSSSSISPSTFLLRWSARVISKTPNLNIRLLVSIKKSIMLNLRGSLSMRILYLMR